MSTAKHVSTPDRCPECAPLPEGWNDRQEAIWQHALAQFLAQQPDINAAHLTRADLVPLVQAHARAAAVARMDRELWNVGSDEPSTGTTYETRPDRITLYLVLAAFFCLALVCAGVWSFLS